MRVEEEFSRNARYYESYNIIQVKVVEKLLSLLKNRPKKILDLGCGSGTLYKKIDFDIYNFIAVDFSKEMLNLHPNDIKIQKICADFNDLTFFETLKIKDFDHIFSASALQWSKDLDRTFSQLKKIKKPLSLAIFTSNTFKSIYETASLEPILRTSHDIENLSKKYFNASLEIKNYKLEFENKKEMFRYIKKSGVSGGRRVLDYRSTKELISNYPYNYLEFEVIFITT